MLANLDLGFLEGVLHDVTDLAVLELWKLLVNLSIVPIGINVGLYNIAVDLVVAIIVIGFDTHLAPQFH